MLFQTPSYVLYSASGSFFIPFFITVGLYIRIFGVLQTRMKRSRSVRSSRRRALTHNGGGGGGCGSGEGAMTDQGGKDGVGERRSVASSTMGLLQTPEKTALCKTGTFDSNRLDSPARLNSDTPCEEDENEYEDLSTGEVGGKPSNTPTIILPGLRVKLCGGSNGDGGRPVTQIAEREGKGGNNHYLLSPNCDGFTQDGDLVSLNNDGSFFLMRDINELVAQDDLASMETVLNDYDVRCQRDVTTVTTNGSLDVKSCKRQYSMTAVGSAKRGRGRVRRVLSVGDTRSTGGGGSSPHRSGARLTRKASVVSAFRNIGSFRSIRESWSSHQQNFEQVVECYT